MKGSRPMRYAPDRPLRLAPATASDYRELARRRLPRQLFDYVDGGAYDEATMRANVADLGRRAAAPGRDARRQRPRSRRWRCSASSSRCRSCWRRSDWRGCSRRAPRCRPRGRRSGRACRSWSRPSRSARSRRWRRPTRTPPWFQLYVMRDRGYAEDLIARARAVGSPVLLLTVDLAVVGARHRDTRNAAGRRFEHDGRSFGARWISCPTRAGSARRRSAGGRSRSATSRRRSPAGRPPRTSRSGSTPQFDPSVTWDDIAWVREQWPGKLVVKGVLDPEDARRAADVGVDGIVVSNHGGRQLDSVPSTVRALPAVVDAVGDEVEVLADGGVRTGLDVVKMVALGARAVLIGRAVGVGGGRPRRGRRAPRARGDEGGHRHRARPHGPDVDRRRSTARRSTRLAPPAAAPDAHRRAGPDPHAGRLRGHDVLHEPGDVGDALRRRARLRSRDARGARPVRGGRHRRRGRLRAHGGPAGGDAAAPGRRAWATGLRTCTTRARARSRS